MDERAMALLLACLGYADDAVKKERLMGVQPDEWQAVAASARQHKVAPLLSHQLARLGIAVPSVVTEDLKQTYRRNVMRNLRRYRDLRQLLLRLREKGIAAIALKGAHLAGNVYDNIGLRTMSDIDLLVRKEDLGRVEQDLLEMGYEAYHYYHNVACQGNNHHFHYTLPITGSIMEIHWKLVPSSYPCRIDLEGLLTRAQPIMLVQVPTLALAPEDVLLHLCLHTAIHSHNMTIRMFCDIGEIVRRNGADMDWHAIGTRARQWGIVRSVYLILRLAQELLDVPVPAGWLSSLQPVDFDKRFLAISHELLIADQTDIGTGPSRQTALFWKAKGIGGKLTMIRNNLFPHETMALMYPAPADSWKIFFYYPVRIKYLLMRHTATLWRLARGDSKVKAVATRSVQSETLKSWLLSG